MLRIIKNIIILSFCSSSLCLAQLNGYKLIPSVRSENDYFGSSVSIDGKYAIVGASGADKVFVFKKSGSGWIESQILEGDSNPAGSTLDPEFGYSVHLAGNYLIVGAPFQVTLPVMSCIGGAYIYMLSGEDWILQKKITPPVAHLFGLFGWSVSISDDYSVVAETDRNTIHIYKRDSSNWTLLTSFNGGWRLGESVAMSGNYILAGTPGGDILDTDGQGSAYIYFNQESNWKEQDKISASDGSKIDEFGEALSLSGNVVIAGDSKALNSNKIRTGAAYIFNREDTIWIEKQKIISSDGELNDLFGYSVAIDGDYAVISAPGDQDNGTNSGSVYIFMNNGGDWTEQQKLIASDGGSYYYFGSSVSISRNEILVSDGGYGLSNTPHNSPGSAYIYRLAPTGVNDPKIQGSAILLQSHPNPFGSNTQINFELSVPSNVGIVIYDINGLEIKTLVNRRYEPGKYSTHWDGENNSGRKVPSGMYFLQMCAGEFVGHEKILFVE